MNFRKQKCTFTATSTAKRLNWELAEHVKTLMRIPQIQMLKMYEELQMLVKNLEGCAP